MGGGKTCGWKVSLGWEKCHLVHAALNTARGVGTGEWRVESIGEWVSVCLSLYTLQA